ncbi:retinitis pigmentosa 9 protein isoform X2 [Dunckerocampus dactyliophorus]|uniref:retinitis pigmentosa 9 protein isoform X2 n=1 Tax=Dunckerocampus dactyliophorus TaxID=161453 RepID=UPI0024069554|nr:retinitis pigmentosa 9 protein isoform X2 [Dunckerocampus dactyliophorus]
MSGRKRERASDRNDSKREHKRSKSSKEDDEKIKSQMKKLNQQVQNLKHVETFYEKPPPGYIKEHEEKPEDCIPAEPGNEEARSFLAHAPTKGLWMPLGKEVKVMQCWRCKRYGHRTGDRECPFFIKGNQKLEQFRVAHEDPMYDLIRENERNEKESRVQSLHHSHKRQDPAAAATSSGPHLLLFLLLIIRLRQLLVLRAPPRQEEEEERQKEKGQEEEK